MSDRIFRRFAGLMVLAATAALGACAPMPYKGLSADDATRIRDVDVRVIVPQESFNVSAAAPGISAVGGLIPALIDASVQASRQQAMAPQLAAFYDAFYAVDFRAEAGAAIVDPAQPLPFRQGSAWVTSQNLLKTEQDAAVAATAKGPAFMRLWVYYSLDTELNIFSVRTAVALWQDGKPQETYKNNLIYQARMPAGTRAQRLDALSADSAALMKGEMRKAGLHVRRMLAYDLAQRSQGGTPTAPSKDSAMVNLGATAVKVTLVRIQEDGDKVLWRDVTGVLFTLDK